MHQTIAHNVPQLCIADMRGNYQMLLRWCHHNRSNDTGARHRHRTNLWGQWNRQPTGQWDKQWHRVSITPSRCRSNCYAQQWCITFFMFGYRTQPWYQLWRNEKRTHLFVCLYVLSRPFSICNGVSQYLHEFLFRILLWAKRCIVNRWSFDAKSIYLST